MINQMAPLRNFVEVNPESVTKTYPHDEILYIDISSVGSGYFAESPKLFSINEAPSRAKRIVRDGDTILATVRPNLRSFMFIKEPDDNTVASTGFAVLRAKDNVVPRFIYYAVTDRRFTGYLTNNTKGTSYPAVDTATVLRGEIPDFNLRQQWIIASILSAYDNLIENNRRRIHLLEQAARLLYKEWFAHLRFPGHEHTPITNGVPEGWERKTYSDLFKFLGGFAFKSTNYQSKGKFGIVTIKNVHDARFVPECLSRLDDIPKKMKAHCALQTGDILLSLTGNVGRACIVVGKNCLLNQRVAKVVSNLGIPKSFRYWTFSNETTQKELANLAYGVAQLNLSLVKLGKREFLKPSSLLLGLFEKIADPIFQQITMLNLEIVQLTQARDLILPRLMNGEVVI